MEGDFIYFKRKLYAKMLQWKNERDGATALLIQGARRIGKSTLVEEFARNEYDSYLLIDFSVAPTEIHDLFKDISDLNFSCYAIASAISDERISRINSIIRALEDTMTVNIAYHANDPNAGLAFTKNSEKFKLYVGDTGLFITLAFKDKDFIENDIYQRLLNDKLKTNLGYVYENMVAQMLRATGKKLFYHTMPFDDGKKYYEVDFLYADGHKVCPIEVKSSGYRTHKSLDVFCGKYSDRISERYVVYTKDLHNKGNVTYVPVYMTMFL